MKKLPERVEKKLEHYRRYFIPEEGFKVRWNAERQYVEIWHDAVDTTKPVISYQAHLDD